MPFLFLLCRVNPPRGGNPRRRRSSLRISPAQQEYIDTNFCLSVDLHGTKGTEKARKKILNTLIKLEKYPERYEKILIITGNSFAFRRTLFSVCDEMNLHPHFVYQFGRQHTSMFAVRRERLDFWGWITPTERTGLARQPKMRKK